MKDLPRRWAALISRWRQFLALKRSSAEVSAILASFIDGEPTGHGADNFMTIPIRDAVLDAIRDDFVRLTERFEEWEPQQPYPAEGVTELRKLIARAQGHSANS